MKNLGSLELFAKTSFLDKLLFTKHLSIMLKSGIPVAEAIATLVVQTKSTTFKKVLNDILKQIKNGESLASALKKHPKTFDHFYISLIDVGEESGTLEKNLIFLTDHLTRSYALQKKIKGALLYPAIVVTTITVVGIGMSIFVLPKLTDLFSTLDVKLPLTTQILLFFANLMKNHGILVIATLLGGILLFRLMINLPSIKPYWHKVVLSVPVFGQFYQNEQLAAFCRNLGIMLKSGLPIRKALDVQYEATTNLVFKKYIADIKKAISKGSAIEQELARGNFSKISPITAKMIGVGEKTGKLDEVFLYLGEFYEDEVDNAAKNLSVVLEPIILLIVGLLVGFVAIAIMSPIYQLSGSIKR